MIGAGTNCMNIFTVAKASQGLAKYVNKHFSDAPSIAIAYDRRIKSDLFSETAAGVFAANGIKAYIYLELMPTPCLSYAVRALGCSARIVITASHNPSKYNGYKEYRADGCQITTEAATAILAKIDKLDIFDDVKSMPSEEAIEQFGIENMGAGHAPLYKYAIGVINGEPDNLCPATDSRKALELILAIYKSATEGKSVNLPPEGVATTVFEGRLDKLVKRVRHNVIKHE